MGEQPLPIEPEFGPGCEEVAEQARGALAGTAARTYELRCGDGLAGGEIFFRNLSTTLTDVLVQVRLLDGALHTGLVRPGDPVFRVPAREARPAIFRDYFRLGVEHILMGWDHLLFVLGMLLLVPDLRRLVGAVTGFTVAHSVTLGLAALDVVHVPGPPVEAVIALSIVLLAVEARRTAATGEATLAIRWPWLVSMAVGLIHGLGFAGALAEFGLPAHARLMSLFAFNVGVEAGQLGFIAVVAPAGWLARRMRPGLATWGRHAALWGVGIAGSFWLVQRLVGFWV